MNGVPPRAARVALSVRRALVLIRDGGIYEVVALRIHNRGRRTVSIRTVGANLHCLDGDFVEVEPVDFKGEPAVVGIEPGDAATLRVPFDGFRGVDPDQLHSFFVELPDETKFHARIGRQCKRLIAEGLESDHESFGDVLMSVTLGKDATDDDVRKCEKALGGEYRKYCAKRTGDHLIFPFL